MEVDGAPSAAVSGGSKAAASSSGGPVLAVAGTQSSIALTVHPLVLMSVSDHWTRVRAQSAGANAPLVAGALLGKQKGRELELCNSFELATLDVEGEPVLDRDFFEAREAAYKEVFPELETLGWYRLGEATASAADVRLQRQFSELSDSAPVFLAMAPGTKPSDQLPLSVYESVVEAGEGGATSLLFLQLPYGLATEEAERIGVDHVARLSSSAAAAAGSSAASKTLGNQLGAVKMLAERLRILLDWLAAVDAGTLPMDHEVMREIAALTHRLPMAASEEFQAELGSQCNDVTLLTYLGALTKTYGGLNQLVTKLNVLYDRHGHQAFRRGRGMPL